MGKDIICHINSQLNQYFNDVRSQLRKNTPKAGNLGTYMGAINILEHSQEDLVKEILKDNPGTKEGSDSWNFVNNIVKEHLQDHKEKYQRDMKTECGRNR